jgi:hypothetical protein
MRQQKFNNLFYTILKEAEETYPVNTSEDPSALPQETESKLIDVDLLNLAKKCLYLDTSIFDQSFKSDSFKIDAESVSPSNVINLLKKIEDIVDTQTPGYIVKFTEEYLKKNNSYNNPENLIDLVKLCKKCLFLNKNRLEQVPDLFALTSKLKDINQTNIDLIRKTLEEICQIGEGLSMDV